MSTNTISSQGMAALVDDRARRRLERKSTLERITSNGTISALVMIAAAVAAVICANTDAYETIHAALLEPITIALGPWSFSLSVELLLTTSSWRSSSCWWASSSNTR